MLEMCRSFERHHLVFASSSSVYGECTTFPVSEAADITRPVSLYAATKMAGELMAYSYADQYGLAVTALRLFTVYGPWGRPDMAIFKFTNAILAGQPVELFAGGTPRRDFTFVADIVQGIVAAIDHPPTNNDQRSARSNLGRGEPVAVTELVAELNAAWEVAPPPIVAGAIGRRANHVRRYSSRSSRSWLPASNFDSRRFAAIRGLVSKLLRPPQRRPPAIGLTIA